MGAWQEGSKDHEWFWIRRGATTIHSALPFASATSLSGSQRVGLHPPARLLIGVRHHLLPETLPTHDPLADQLYKQHSRNGEVASELQKFMGLCSLGTRAVAVPSAFNVFSGSGFGGCAAAPGYSLVTGNTPGKSFV